MTGIISPLTTVTEGYIVDLTSGEIIYSSISTQCRVLNRLGTKIRGRLFTKIKLDLTANISNNLSLTVKNQLGARICPQL